MADSKGGEATVEFTWSMTVGADGVDADPANPFCRALDQLLRTGKPFERLALSFCALPDAPGGPATLRWFGAFVYSAGGRLLFFPGYAVMPDAAAGVRGTSPMWRANAAIDHLSLERERGRWHATTPRSRDHFGGPTVVDLGEGRCLWFGLSVADPTALRPARKGTLVSAAVPGVDAARRTEVFRKAREATSFPVVSLHPETRPGDGPGFYHFSVIVGPVGFPDYTGCEHAFPKGSPFVTPPLPDYLPGVAASSYRCRLDPFCDFLVTSMRLPGRVTVPWTVTSPGTRQTDDPG